MFEFYDPCESCPIELDSRECKYCKYNEGTCCEYCCFDKDSGVPIGCFSSTVLHRNVGMVFDSSSEALQIVSRLKSQGYFSEIVDYRRIEMLRAEVRYRMYPGSDDKKTEYISARIDSDSKKLLEKIAIKEDRTFSYLVNRIIKDYLKSQSQTY